MATEEGLNRISLRVPEEMFDRLKRKAFDERTSFQDVGLALFQQWLDGEADAPPPDDPAVQDFREYLNSTAPAEEKRALKVNVQVFLDGWRRRSSKKKSA